MRICILLQLFTWWAPVCFVRAQTDRCRPQHLSPLLLFLALQSFQTDLDDYISSLSRPTRSPSAAWVSLAKSSTMMSWIGRYLTPALRSNRLSLLLIQLHLLVVEPQARPRIAVCLAPKHLWWFSFWPALLQQLRFWKISYSVDLIHWIQFFPRTIVWWKGLKQNKVGFVLKYRIPKWFPTLRPAPGSPCQTPCPSHKRLSEREKSSQPEPVHLRKQISPWAHLTSSRTGSRQCSPTNLASL